jgi:membrane protein required for colicin V production
MLGIYLVFSFITYAVARGYRDWLEKKRFEEYDKHLGAVFGFLKGAVGGLVLTFFLVGLSPRSRELVLGTYSGFAAGWIMHELRPVMPAELNGLLAPYMEKLDPERGAPPWIRAGSPSGNPPGGDDPFAGGAPAAPQGGAEKGAGGPPESGEPLRSWEEELLGVLARKLPRKSQLEIADLVAELIENARSDEIEALAEELERAAPAAVDALLDRFLIDRREPDPRPSGSASVDSKRTARLIEEIADVLERDPRKRATRIREIEARLAGVPAAAAARAIEDWHSDLLAIDPDPDPQTDLAADLDERLRRQR